MKKVASFLFLAVVVLGACLAVALRRDDAAPRYPASVPAHYERLSAGEKQDILWGLVEESTHATLPAYAPFGALQLAAMGMQELGLKGRRQSDFAPDGWTKHLHRRGAIAKVRLVPRAGHFTGVFAGAEHGLLRLSLTYKVEGDRPVAPGLALKILRDGVPSANVSALVALDGQGRDHNFFKSPMSNIVPAGAGMGQRLVHRLFSRVSRWPEELRVEHMAQLDARGSTVGNTISPGHLFFVPGPELKSAASPHDVREDFLAIPAGTVVYTLHAAPPRQDPGAAYTHEEAMQLLARSTPIADLVTTSPFLASQFGDEGIFFRHEFR